ncbi:MAG: VOC family protein [Pyrinomonadaceae bacterium]
MLHFREGLDPVKNEYPEAMPFYMMVFETADLRETAARLKTKGEKILNEKRSDKGALEAIIFEDPFGIILEIVRAGQ